MTDFKKSSERRWRISVILTSITNANKNNRIVSEEKLVLEAMDQFGISIRTAKMYLNELEMRNSIVRYAGEVWTKQKWDQAGNILTEGIKLIDSESSLMEEEKKERARKIEEGID